MEKEEKITNQFVNDFSVPKVRVIIILLVVVVLLLFFTFNYFFIHSKVCRDIECFKDAVKSCKRINFVREDPSVIWRYRIIGNTKAENCKIEVELVRLLEGKNDLEYIEGKSMICNTPKGDLMFPEKDLAKCSGELKEGFQELIIQRMHNYLLENLGEIQVRFDEI